MAQQIREPPSTDGYPASCVLEEDIVKDKHTCGVCFDIIFRKWSCRVCKKGFCENCLQNCHQISGTTRCPNCRSDEGFSRQLDEPILQLKCRCVADSCEWRGHLRQFRMHIIDCSKADIQGLTPSGDLVFERSNAVRSYIELEPKTQVFDPVAVAIFLKDYEEGDVYEIADDSDDSEGDVEQEGADRVRREEGEGAENRSSNNSNNHKYVGKFISREERLNQMGDQAKDFTNSELKNFANLLSDDKLCELFEPFGKIISYKAIESLNGWELDGRELCVGRAQKKSERQAELKEQFGRMKAERTSRYCGVNLCIKNLDDCFDDERLLREFSQFGNISSAKVMLDNERSKGFGFVCFVHPEDAARAMTEMNGRIVVNKPLFVAKAQRKEERRSHLASQYMHRFTSLPLPTGQPMTQIYPAISAEFFVPTISAVPPPQPQIQNYYQSPALPPTYPPAYPVRTSHWSQPLRHNSAFAGSCHGGNSMSNNGPASVRSARCAGQIQVRGHMNNSRPITGGQNIMPNQRIIPNYPPPAMIQQNADSPAVQLINGVCRGQPNQTVGCKYINQAPIQNHTSQVMSAVTSDDNIDQLARKAASSQKMAGDGSAGLMEKRVDHQAENCYGKNLKGLWTGMGVRPTCSAHQRSVPHLQVRPSNLAVVKPSLLQQTRSSQLLQQLPSSRQLQAHSSPQRQQQLRSASQLSQNQQLYEQQLMDKMCESSQMNQQQLTNQMTNQPMTNQCQKPCKAQQSQSQLAQKQQSRQPTSQQRSMQQLPQRQSRLQTGQQQLASQVARSEDSVAVADASSGVIPRGSTASRTSQNNTYSNAHHVANGSTSLPNNISANAARTSSFYQPDPTLNDSFDPEQFNQIGQTNGTFLCPAPSQDYMSYQSEFGIRGSDYQDVMSDLMDNGEIDQLSHEYIMSDNSYKHFGRSQNGKICEMYRDTLDCHNPAYNLSNAQNSVRQVPGYNPDDHLPYRDQYDVSSGHAAGTPFLDKVSTVIGVGGIDLCAENQDFPGRVVCSLDTEEREGVAWKIVPTRLPSCVHHHGVAAIGSKIYVMGGAVYKRGESLGKATAAVCMYDPTEGLWKNLLPLPEPRAYLGAAAWRQQIFAVCGENENKVWIQLNPLTMPRCHAALISMSDSLLLIGGRTRLKDKSISSLSSILEYDVNTDSWVEKANMKQGRHDMGCATVGSLLYIAGGIRSPKPECLTSLECYNTQTGQWLSNMPPYPYPTAGLGLVTITETSSAPSRPRIVSNRESTTSVRRRA